MMEEFLEDAQAMKERFPDLLASFTVEQVCEIWQEYSCDHWCATWIAHDDNEAIVRHVFTELYTSGVQA